METQMLCRICFDLGHLSIKDYEVNVHGNDVSMQQMLQRFSELEPVDEIIPEMICKTCTHDLVQSYFFAEKIKQADERILSLFYPQPQEPPIGYEEEVESQKDSGEDCNEEITSQNSQIIEEQFTDEDEDTMNMTSESNNVEEVFIDPESPEIIDEIISIPETHSVPPKRNYTITQNFLCEEASHSILVSNNESVREVLGEPKQKLYCKKGRRSKEVNGNGSFVIAQFTPSLASNVQVENFNSEDNDEVILSDIRTMNFEAIEVKADNINVIVENDQGELPIDDCRVYLCQYCPKAFSSSPFLMAHVRKSHGCKYCARLFEKSADLYKHIREEHTTFKCVVCEKDYISNSNLRNHLKSVHKIKVPANVALLSYKKNEDNDA